LPIRALLGLPVAVSLRPASARWRRALQETSTGEAKREGRRQEEGRLAAGELLGSLDELEDVLVAQGGSELVNLTCGGIDIVGYRRIVLVPHLSACCLQRDGYRGQAGGCA